MPFPSSKLPPGPSFILRQLSSWQFALYAASVYLVCVGNQVLGLNVLAWVVVSCSIPALPCILLAHTQYQYWKDGRKAASLGARLAPTVPMRLPGGVDLITTRMKEFHTGYLGEYTYRYLVPGGSIEPLQAMRSFLGWPRVVRPSTCVPCGHPV